MRLPETVKLVNVPRDVMFGCVAVVRVPLMFPETSKLVNVPRDVIFGCAAVCSVPVRFVAV